MTQFADQTIAIVGLGLIGGSIARGLRAANPGQTILAVDQEQSALDEALAAGVVSKSCSLQQATEEADLLVLAVPPLLIEKLIPELAAITSSQCTITDVGSAKSHIVAQIVKQEPAFQQRFVPGHPIAGSEKSGFSAARAELFQDRKVILTPISANSASAVQQVHELWRCLGCQVLGMSVQRHDQVLAATSHLPHVLAFTLVDALLQQQESDEILRYAAGGFADFSRLASSDARMWADVFIANGAATGKVLDDYIDYLQRFRATIAAQDHDTMMAVFARARQGRENFIARHYQNGNKQEMETYEDFSALKMIENYYLKMYRKIK